MYIFEYNRNITFTVNIFAKLFDKHHACLYIPMTLLVHDLKNIYILCCLDETSPKENIIIAVTMGVVFLLCLLLVVAILVYRKCG